MGAAWLGADRAFWGGVPAQRAPSSCPNKQGAPGSSQTRSIPHGEMPEGAGEMPPSTA